MKPVLTLITATGLLGSSLALAHGGHAELPQASLLHLLAHNWPLLLAVVTLAGLYVLRRKRRD